MYSIKIYDGINDYEGITIHSPYVDNLKVKINSHTVLDGVSDMNFTITPNNPGWNKIRPLRTLIELTNTKTNKVIFSGRILKPNQNMKSDGMFSIEYVCEDKKAYLNDSYQRYTKPQNNTVKGLFTLILDTHNSQVESHKQFKAGNVTVTDPNDNVYRGLGYEKTFATIQDKLIDRLGGYLVVREEADGTYLDYLKNVGEISDTPIRLRSNLKDLQRDIDPTEIITRLVVLGSKMEIRKGIVDSLESIGSTQLARVEIQDSDEMWDIPLNLLPSGTATGSRLTIYGEAPNYTFTSGFDDSNETSDNSEPRLSIKTVNNGKDYIDNTALIAEFGIIEGTLLYDDINTPSTLLLRGKQFFASQAAARVSYAITPLDLSVIDDNFDSLEVGNWHKVINEVLEIDESLQIIEKTIDGDNPHLSKVVMGEKYRTLSQYQVETRKKMKSFDQLQTQVSGQSATIITLRTELKTVDTVIKKITLDLQNNDLGEISESVGVLTDAIVDLYLAIGAIPTTTLASSTNDGLLSSALYMKLISLQLATQLIDGLMSKEDKTLLDKAVVDIGNKTLLNTVNKTDLVSAINELNTRVIDLET